jgi:AmiR/NasT family two-component response regulator
MSGSVHDETAEDAFNAGATAYVEKGPLGDDLVDRILAVAREPSHRES